MIHIILMILVALIVIGIALAMLLFYRKRKMPPTDYYTLFIMGLCWTPLGVVGVATDNPGFYGFFGIGAAFIAIGLANRDKWKKNHRSWAQLSDDEQKFKAAVMIGLAVLMLVGLVAFILIR